jgi:nucleoside-diphosphate-sugar epimerase
MRNATVYGVSPRLRLDIVLNNLAAWSHVTGKIRLLSDGMSWRPLLHVRDLAKVAVRMVEAPSELVAGRAFNIGSAAQNYLVRDLAEVLAEVTGCEVEFAGDASPDPRSYRVDFSELERAFPDLELDWNARRGAEELVGAYRAVGLTEDDFEGRSYIRLRQLRHLLDEHRLDDDLRWAQS